MDVGLLEQLNGAQRQQIRVAGTRADDVNLAETATGCGLVGVYGARFRIAVRGGRVGSRELAVELRACVALVTGEHARADDAADDALPERPALFGGERALHFAAPIAGRSGRGRRALPGSKASICCLTRRASTGELPLEPTATTTGERSMIAGKMKVDSSGSSTTLIGSRRPLRGG